MDACDSGWFYEMFNLAYFIACLNIEPRYTLRSKFSVLVFKNYQLYPKGQIKEEEKTVTFQDSRQLQ